MEEDASDNEKMEGQMFEIRESMEENFSTVLVSMHGLTARVGGEAKIIEQRTCV